MTKVTVRKYATDLTDAQWCLIRGYFKRPSKRGRPRKYDRRDVINAILYVVKTGCQWRMLPNDFPPWKAVYQMLYRWRKSGLWDKIHDKLRKLVRKSVGKKSSPTAGIIDSQSVKTTSVGGEQRGYDAGKKTVGRKRHIIVDTLGMLSAVVVHSAGTQDQHGAVSVLERLRESFKRLRKIFADSAYKRNNLPERMETEHNFDLEIVQRPEGTKGFVVQKKRWIVERTLGWLSLSRRHSKDYERNPQTSEVMINITMIHLMLKRLKPTNT